MLQKIRKTTDSIIFRFFLGIVVLSFAIWGVSDVIKGVYNSDIVTFKNIAPITYQEFDIARSNEIKQMQHHQGVSLSEDQLDQMNISENVLQKLVQAKLMNYLTNEYELNFSDEVIAEVIRGFPFLKNADGIFDIERLKSYLHANNMGIEQYSNEIRNYLSNNLILSSFIGNSYIPKARITNIIDHMSERRVVDIAHLSLKPTKLPDIEATEEQLKNFYNEKKIHSKLHG
ncbi:MAG UNVERIFIED_CONTAM: SurA N-terminal domain-containing protein [Rickettsiaceae bacterium]